MVISTRMLYDTLMNKNDFAMLCLCAYTFILSVQNHPVLSHFYMPCAQIAVTAKMASVVYAIPCFLNFICHALKSHVSVHAAQHAAISLWVLPKNHRLKSMVWQKTMPLAHSTHRMLQIHTNDKSRHLSPIIICCSKTQWLHVLCIDL